jgi:O-antigen/teichoic acid export membrane protein
MLKKIYTTKINVLANFISTFWQAIISIALVPLYLKYLGVESYGLISIFMSFQAFLSVFDFGLSHTLNRELARLSVIPDSIKEMRDLTRTLELLNWGTAIILGLFLMALSPILAIYWIPKGVFTVQSIIKVFVIMSMSFAFQWTILFYSRGLASLQKQVLLNFINILFVTLRSVGALLVLIYISQTLEAFLIWQSCITCLQLFVLALALWRSIPDLPYSPQFQKVLLKQVRHFASGMTGIGVVSLILTQIDKVILSRLVSLESIGYYMLAGTISTMLLGGITNAVDTAVYPKFSQLVAINDEIRLRELYHQSCQFMSVLLIPSAAILAFFSWEILLIWTRNEAITTNTYLLLTIVATGTGIHGLMWMPFRVQLAYGWTKLSFYQNVVAILFFVPFIIYGVIHYGAIGGAVSLLILYTGYALIPLQIMHKRILQGELKKWYINDFALPLLATCCVVGISFSLLPKHSSQLFTVVWVGSTWVSAVIISTIVSVDLRKVALELIKLKLDKFQRVI